MELKSHCRAMATDFEFRRLSFVLELKGALQEEQLEAAQNRASNALKRSQATAFELFRTNLEQDQLHRRKFLSTTFGDQNRLRASVIETLEAGLRDACLGLMHEW